MRWLDFRARRGRGPAPRTRAACRIGVSLAIASLALASGLRPSESLATVLAGDGRLVRVDAVVVWDGERQVLALLPQLHSLGDDAFLVIPIPPGAEIAVAPDPDMFSSPDPDPEDETTGEPPAEEDDEAEGSAPAQRSLDAPMQRGDFRRLDRGRMTGRRVADHRGPGESKDEDGAAPARSRDSRDGDEESIDSPMELRDRIRLDKRAMPMPGRRHGIPGRDVRRPMDRSRVIAALRQRQPALVRPDDEPLVLRAEQLPESLRELIGQTAYQALPSAAMEAYRQAGWGLAVIQVPRRDGRIRFGPLAFAMEMERPLIPVRLASGAGRHQVSIRFISAEELTEIRAEGEEFGLRHTQRPVPVDAALGAWMTAVGVDSTRPWRVHGLGTGILDTERHPLRPAGSDLYLPASPRRRPEPVEPAPEGRERRSGRGCGCSVPGDFDGIGGLVVLSLFVIGLFLLGRRGRSRGAARMISASPVCALALFMGEPALASEPAGEEGDRLSRRLIRYPEATEEGSAPPVLRVVFGGAPLAIYFPDQLLDSRAEVHFVSKPERFSLRIAERTAYLSAMPEASAGDEALATLTLSCGRPLSFTIRVVSEGASGDAAVDVRTATESDAECLESLALARDELADCAESSEERAVALIAGMLIEAPSGDRAVEHRDVRQRDKQNRIYVEVVDAVRIYRHTFVRVRIENRDGSRRTWVAGAPSITIVGPGPRRQPLQVIPVFERRTLETGESALVVVGVETPQIPTGAGLRLVLHEADGPRHVVIEDLRI